MTWSRNKYHDSTLNTTLNCTTYYVQYTKLTAFVAVILKYMYPKSRNYSFLPIHMVQLLVTFPPRPFHFPEENKWRAAAVTVFDCWDYHTMDRSKISFAVGGGKKQATGLEFSATENEETPGDRPVIEAESSVKPSDNNIPPGECFTETPKPSNSTSSDVRSKPPRSEQPETSKARRPRKPKKRDSDMAEPPAKRAKRTDSSAMWERSSSRPADVEHHKGRSTNESGTTREKRDNRDRYHGRDERRHRSRSRDRAEKWRERSRSRDRERRDGGKKRSGSWDRDGGRHRNGDRGDEREKRDRKRSTSRERHRSRRGISSHLPSIQS